MGGFEGPATGRAARRRSRDGRGLAGGFLVGAAAAHRRGVPDGGDGWHRSSELGFTGGVTRARKDHSPPAPRAATQIAGEAAGTM